MRTPQLNYLQQPSCKNMNDSQTQIGSTSPLLDRWNRNKSNQTWLSTLLEDPKMQDLVAVLQEQGTPTPVDLVSLPGDVMTRMGLMQAQTMGYHSALKNLRMLQQLSHPSRALSHDGWRGLELQEKYGVSEVETPA